MGKHTGSGRGSDSQSGGKHRAGELSAEEKGLSASQRAQLRRQGGYDVGGRTPTRDAQRHSDSGQTHSRD